MLPESVLASPSTVPGYPTLALAIDAMQRYLDACISAGVQYGLGAKCVESHLGVLPITFTAIDCSGMFRTLIAAGTRRRWSPTDGSVNQHAQIAAMGFKPTDYAECANEDGHLRVGFITPASSGEGVGHVWLCRNGRTLESHGGRGPDSRAWDTDVLLREVAACYVLC